MPTATLKRWPISVELYHKMIARGILTKSDRVELLGGELIEMSPIGDAHFHSEHWLERFFTRHLSETEADVCAELPVVLGEHDEPEPDVMLLRPREGGYRRKPRAEDVLLIVKVSETSLTTDRAVKVPRYAAAGIPEVWLVDTRGKAVEVYRSPVQGKKPKYAEKRRHARGETIAPRAFPKLKVAIDRLV